MNVLETSTFFALGTAPDGGGLLTTLPMFAVVLAIFYFIVLLPSKRQRQKVQQFLDGLKVGDKVVTTGGIYGQVTRLGGESVQLQIADKVRVEISKNAVGGYQGQAPVQDAPASDEAKS
jgi:preprotein translocase subunit YajC